MMVDIFITYKFKKSFISFKYYFQQASGCRFVVDLFRCRVALWCTHHRLSVPLCSYHPFITCFFYCTIPLPADVNPYTAYNFRSQQFNKVQVRVKKHLVNFFFYFEIKITRYFSYTKQTKNNKNKRSVAKFVMITTY